MASIILQNNINSKGESTLVIDCFGMGVWIGGLITYQAFRLISERGWPLSIITPGVNKNEIFEILEKLAPKFDNVILCGYPPFLKDIVDQAPANGVIWNKLKKIKIVFAAESFSENFREYIARQVGIKNIYTDMMNVYGTADLGTMATETPVSIFLRKMALKTPQLFAQMFPGTNLQPTLAQFNPFFVNFDSQNGLVFCTGNSGLPLLRYHVGDNGGIIEYDKAVAMCKQFGIDIEKEAVKLGFDKTIVEMPLVYVYERADLSTKLYGAIIYPQHVKMGIPHPGLEKYLTHKFTMQTKSDRQHNQFLEIHLELRPGVRSGQNLKRRATELISQALLKNNAEHYNNASFMGKKVTPKITLWPHEHPTHFGSGGKQRWVKN